LPPRSASNTLPRASLRSARTGTFTGSCAITCSCLPRPSLFTSSAPRAKITVAVARSSSGAADAGTAIANSNAIVAARTSVSHELQGVLRIA
jgi:hypothetical protein